jgi:hypothetical protein
MNRKLSVEFFIEGRHLDGGTEESPIQKSHEKGKAWGQSYKTFFVRNLQILC